MGYKTSKQVEYVLCYVIYRVFHNHCYSFKSNLCLQITIKKKQRAQLKHPAVKWSTTKVINWKWMNIKLNKNTNQPQQQQNTERTSMWARDRENHELLATEFKAPEKK